MSYAEVGLLMLDEATYNGARLVWSSGGNDTAPDLEKMKQRPFEFSWPSEQPSS